MKDSGIADLLTPKDTPYSLPKDISPKAKPVKPQEEERFRDESPASVRKIEKPPLISPDLPPDFTERYFFTKKMDFFLFFIFFFLWGVFLWVVCVCV